MPSTESGHGPLSTQGGRLNEKAISRRARSNSGFSVAWEEAQRGCGSKSLVEAVPAAMLNVHVQPRRIAGREVDAGRLGIAVVITKS